MADKSGENCQQQVENEEEIITGYKNVVAYSSKALRSLLLSTKAVNDLPTAGDDFDYYSSFSGFRELMDMEGKRILETLQSVMRYHGLKGNLTRNPDAAEMDDKFDILVDANDQILERVGIFLDEAAGLRKQEADLVIATMTSPRQISGSWNKKTPNKNVMSTIRLLSAKNIVRPQLRFKEKVDNTNRPFIPVIKEKYNALRPLPESLLITQKEDIREIVDIEKDIEFPHPYQYELDHFTTPDILLKKCNPQKWLPMDETPLTHVDNETTLNKVLEKLMKEKEIAVDLEHHAFRTFQGLTCLMQISTRSEDFIFDTLALRSDLHILNQVFTNPDVVKVLHGADKDIEWLQRDLGLYMVNMFDTGQAARVLRLARFSLAHLLRVYCQVDADKQYQLADWRIRPLPAELVQYAREDTHYLLYIYDTLRNELIDKSNFNLNLLHAVVNRSTQLCAKRYEKPVFTTDKYMSMYQQSKKIFNAKQLHALKAIYAWRDSVAREEDESEGYVLPNHMLLQIADLLPKERQGILACCNPIPPLLRQNLPEIHSFIMEARDIAITKPVQKPKTPVRPTKRDHPKYREDNMLHCPHDLSHRASRPDPPNFGIPPSDIVAEESSLFRREWTYKIKPIMAAAAPRLSAFALSSTMKENLSTAKKKALKIEQSFTSPYGMFLPSEVSAKSNVVRPHRITKWRLKANTEKPKSVKEANIVIAETGPARIAQEEEEKGVLSLNQMLKEDPSAADVAKKVKKDKKSKNRPQLTAETEERIQMPVMPKPAPDSGGATDGGKKRKKDKLTSDDVEKEGAHDYSMSDFAIFAASSAKKSKKEKDKEKKKEYNPDTVQFTSHHKDVKKPRLNPLSGQKSQTFGKQQHQQQASWPKR